MVLSIDACMRCGGLTKRFLKHRYMLILRNKDWDIYTWPNDSSTHSWNKIDEHSPVHYLIPYHLVNHLTTWLTGTKPNWDRICVSKNALLIHHISHKSQWTKPLNESTVSKIHIGTGTESHLQRSSFDSVHFLEFYFFFFANRYVMVERCSL